MKTMQIILLMAASLLVGACGKDDGGQKQGAAPTTPTAPTGSASAPAAMPSATRYIDHTKDEVEFRLKASLAGLESLLEDVSDSEQVAMIKKDIATLQAKLADL